MLGILDWGIGGIRIYKLIKQRLGDVPVIYFSDTGATPYGKMSRAELVARLDNVIDFLIAQGATNIVIGCNAASTAIPFLDDHGIRIEGVIETAVEVATKAKPKRFGLIGGRRTVLSGVYRRAFAMRGIRLEQRIAQPLSALIESGDVGSETLKNEAERILAPLKNCSHILLACTHYPAIENLLRKFVSPETIFVDPAESLAVKVGKWKLNGNGTDRFLTTGDPGQMKHAAKLAFDVAINNVEKIRI
jgi:glutamate racemase